jgi:hypothetical protein
MRWLLVAALVLVSSCLPMSRGADIPPGAIRGRVVRTDGAPAAFARITVDRAHRVVVADGSGTFTIRGLPAGTYMLRTERDDNSDGQLDVGALVPATLLADARGGVGFTSLGDVTLLPALQADGVVVDGAGASVVAVRVAADGSRFAEEVVRADVDGSYRFPALLSASTIEVLAVSADGTAVSALQQKPMPPPADVGQPPARVTFDPLVLVAATQPLRLAITPAVGDALVTTASSRGTQTFAVAIGNGVVEVDVRDDAGPFDVLVQAGELEGFLSGVVAGDVTWAMFMQVPTCVLIGAPDCDGDGVVGLPYTDVVGVPDLPAWRACASTCSVFGADLDVARCAFDNVVYDCDDDSDGQPDVTEPAECRDRGDDFDGDGLCGSADAFPNCRANSDISPSCAPGVVPPPPVVRGEFEQPVVVDGCPDDTLCLAPTALLDGSRQPVSPSLRVTGLGAGSGEHMIAARLPQIPPVLPRIIEVDGQRLFAFEVPPFSLGASEVMLVPVAYSDGSGGYAVFSQNATLLLAGNPPPTPPTSAQHLFVVAPIAVFPDSEQTYEYETVQMFRDVQLSVSTRATLTITRAFVASDGAQLKAEDDQMGNAAYVTLGGEAAGTVVGNVLATSLRVPADGTFVVDGITALNGETFGVDAGAILQVRNFVGMDIFGAPAGAVKLGPNDVPAPVGVVRSITADALFVVDDIDMTNSLAANRLTMADGQAQTFVITYRGEDTAIGSCCNDAIDELGNITCTQDECEPAVVLPEVALTPGPHLVIADADLVTVDSLGAFINDQVADNVADEIYVDVPNELQQQQRLPGDPSFRFFVREDVASITVGYRRGLLVNFIDVSVVHQPRVIAVDCTAGAPIDIPFATLPARWTLSLGRVVSHGDAFPNEVVSNTGVTLRVDCATALQSIAALPATIRVAPAFSTYTFDNSTPVIGVEGYMLLVVGSTTRVGYAWTGRSDVGDGGNNNNWLATDGARRAPDIDDTAFLVDVGQPPPTNGVRTGTLIVGFQDDRIEDDGSSTTSADLSGTEVANLLVGDNDLVASAVPILLRVPANGTSTVRGQVGGFDVAAGTTTTVNAPVRAGVVTVFGELIATAQLDTGPMTIAADGRLRGEAPVTLNSLDIAGTASFQNTVVTVTNTLKANGAPANISLSTSTLQTFAAFDAPDLTLAMFGGSVLEHTGGALGTIVVGTNDNALNPTNPLLAPFAPVCVDIGGVVQVGCPPPSR